MFLAIHIGIAPLRSMNYPRDSKQT
jgi:hypothetical protein